MSFTNKRKVTSAQETISHISIRGSSVELAHGFNHGSPHSPILVLSFVSQGSASFSPNRIDVELQPIQVQELLPELTKEFEALKKRMREDVKKYGKDHIFSPLYFHGDVKPRIGAAMPKK